MDAEDRQEEELIDEFLDQEAVSPTPNIIPAVAPSPAKHDPYEALRFRDFRLLLVGRFIASLGNQMVTVAVGWELWLRTQNTLALGLVGLVQIIPIITLALPAGHTADRYNRKTIILVMQGMLSLCSLGLAVVSLTQAPLIFVYVCLLFIGIARSLSDPTSSAFLSQTVPPEKFTSAATWSSSAWQLAAVFGPAIGGLLLDVVGKPALIYVIDACGSVLFIVLIYFIRARQQARVKEPMTRESLSAGARFVWNTKVILAAITLDMFAVLFGGAVALLPVYSTDVLKVGAAGFGWLRAAPSIGALCMAFFLAHRRPFTQAGRTLLIAVAGFGIATIIFGLSRSFPLSLIMLAALGALDNISVVIRSTLMLTRTPDIMRGRISAVNSVFIGTSNELGSFESGVSAAFLGPVGSVVFGGIGTILVVLGVAYLFPDIRNLKKLRPD